jgi:hypothetical protein
MVDPNIVNISKTFRIPFRKSKRLEGTKTGKAVCGRMKDVLQWRREALKIFRILSTWVLQRKSSEKHMKVMDRVMWVSSPRTSKYWYFMQSFELGTTTLCYEKDCCSVWYYEQQCSVMFYGEQFCLILCFTVNNTALYCVLLWTILPYTVFNCEQFCLILCFTVNNSALYCVTANNTALYCVLLWTILPYTVLLRTILSILCYCEQ